MGSEDLQAKLYVILGSHACRTGMLLLEHKRIPYKQVTVPAGMQKLMPLWGFPGRSVPALQLDGLALLTYRTDTGAEVERRPAGAFLDRVIPA